MVTTPGNKEEAREPHPLTKGQKRSASYRREEHRRFVVTTSLSAEDIGLIADVRVREPLLKLALADRLDEAPGFLTRIKSVRKKPNKLLDKYLVKRAWILKELAGRRFRINNTYGFGGEAKYVGGGMTAHQLRKIGAFRKLDNLREAYLSGRRLVGGIASEHNAVNALEEHMTMKVRSANYRKDLAKQRRAAQRKEDRAVAKAIREQRDDRIKSAPDVETMVKATATPAKGVVTWAAQSEFDRVALEVGKAPTSKNFVWKLAAEELDFLGDMYDEYMSCDQMEPSIVSDGVVKVSLTADPHIIRSLNGSHGEKTESDDTSTGNNGIPRTPTLTRTRSGLEVEASGWTFRIPRPDQQVTITGNTGIVINGVNGSTVQVAPEDIESSVYEELLNHGFRNSENTLPTSDIVDYHPSDDLNGAQGEVTGTDDMANAVSTLRHCYSNPFDPQAEGAKILDEYAYDSVSRKSHISCTIQPSSDGTFSLVFLPGVAVSAMNLNESATFTYGGAHRYTNTDNVYGLVDANTLYALFMQYRVVGGGIRVRNLMTPLTATGRLEVVQVPCTAPGANYNTLMSLNFSSKSLSETFLGDMPLNATTFNLNSFLALNGADEYTASELDKHDLISTHKVASPNYYEFKNTSTSLGDAAVSTGMIQEGMTYSTTGGNVNGSTYAAGITDVRGMNAILLRGTGFPVGSVVLEIEHILHVEGIPYPSTTTAFQPSMEHGTAIDPLAMPKAVAALNSRPDSIILAQVRAHGKKALSGISDAFRNKKSKTKSKTKRVANRVTDAVIRGALSRMGLERPAMRKKKGGRKRK